MKAVHLDILISDVDRPDRLEAVVAKVIRDGFILNSIKSEIGFDLKQTSSPSSEELDLVQKEK